jgi:hypothetical protein
MDAKVQQSWEDFLDPDLMRNQLISASIYIAGFEALKDAVVGRIRDFFRIGFDESGDNIDPKYQTDVLSRNNSPIYASLDWLKEMHAINDADIAAFGRVKTCRNILAHRLLATLGSDGMPPAFEKCFQEMVALLHKIEVWWIREVEIPTNPDFDGQEVDEDGIMPGPIMVLRLLCDIALGDEKTSRYYFDEFRKRAGGR